LWDDYDGSWINAMNFIDSTISKYDSGLIEYKEYMDLVANFNKKELKDSNYYVQILSLREMQDLKIRLDDPKDYVDPIDFIQPRKSMYSDRLLV
jgi:hypothetical protein